MVPLGGQVGTTSLARFFSPVELFGGAPMPCRAASVDLQGADSTDALRGPISLFSLRQLLRYLTEQRHLLSQGVTAVGAHHTKVVDHGSRPDHQPPELRA
jgi:hypothetical protein